MSDVIDVPPQTALTVSQRAAMALGAADHEVKLIALARSSAGIVGITNSAGYQECHAARMALKNTRLEITKRGKGAREDATAYSKAIIAEEGRLIGIIEPEEQRLQKIQDAHDARVAAEKAAKEAAEKARKAAHEARITALRDYVLSAAECKASACVDALISRLQLDPLEGYEEYAKEAIQVRDTVFEKLTAASIRLKAAEDERARIQAEQAEITRQQAIRQAELDRVAAEQAAAAKLAAEAKARQDAADAEARRQQAVLDKAASDKLEAERKALADERAELDRQKAEARQAEDDRIAAEASRAAAEAAEFEQEKAGLAFVNALCAADGIVEPESGKLLQLEMPAPANPVREIPSALSLIEAVASYCDVTDETAQSWLIHRAIEISQAAP